jgi:hypothetical protein
MALMRMCQVRVLARSLLISLVLMMGLVYGQNQAPPVSPASALEYLTESGVGVFWHDQLVALGDRLQKPGKERVILTGTYTDASGTQPIRLVWELPGKLRVDLMGATPLTLISAGAGVLRKGGNAAIADDDLLESLRDDRPEIALFGGGGGHASWRFLGARFRTDDGTTPNYTGPLFDIYQIVSAAKGRSDKAIRWKLFIFDSISKLLARTQYVVERSGQDVAVETDWSSWTSTGGDPMPGQIFRLENGKPVMTINITAGQTAPTANDTIFVQP